MYANVPFMPILIVQRIFIRNHAGHFVSLFIEYESLKKIKHIHKKILIFYFSIWNYLLFKKLVIKLKLTFFADAEMNFTIWQLPSDKENAKKLSQNYGIT